MLLRIWRNLLFIFTTKDLARLLIQKKIEIVFTDLAKQPNQTAAAIITILTAYWEKFCPKMTAKIVKACCYQYSVGKPSAFTAKIVISTLLEINSATLLKVEGTTSHLMAPQHPDRCVSITLTAITSAIRLKALIEDQFKQIEALNIRNFSEQDSVLNVVKAPCASSSYHGRGCQAMKYPAMVVIRQFVGKFALNTTNLGQNGSSALTVPFGDSLVVEAAINLQILI
ncbi:MAG: hypothetical protein EZS28_045652, partial [Streblomastix strix]